MYNNNKEQCGMLSCLLEQNEAYIHNLIITINGYKLHLTYKHQRFSLFCPGGMVLIGAMPLHWCLSNMGSAVGLSQHQEEDLAIRPHRLSVQGVLWGCCLRAGILQKHRTQISLGGIFSAVRGYVLLSLAFGKHIFGWFVVAFWFPCHSD